MKSTLDMLPDRRRREGIAIANAIMMELRDILPDEIAGEVHERIWWAIYSNGVLLVRDDERAKLGLEPCDRAGWTPSERVKYEQDRIEAMQIMAAFPAGDAERKK